MNGEYEMNNGKEYASKGVAGTGLGLGIAGTALGLLSGGAAGLGLLNGNNGTNGSNRYGGAMTECEQEIIGLKSTVAKLESEMYTNNVATDLYTAIVQFSNKEDEKIQANQKEVMSYIVDLAKDVALNKQSAYYENLLMQQNVQCCCDKMKLADEAILTYVTSNYVPAMKKLSIDQICPQPMLMYNSWKAPTDESASTPTA